VTDLEFMEALWRVYEKSAVLHQPNGSRDCIECLRPMTDHDDECPYPQMLKEAKERGIAR
jgi:hypothetical protein